jgi:hypothetical protein
VKQHSLCEVYSEGNLAKTFPDKPSGMGVGEYIYVIAPIRLGAQMWTSGLLGIFTSFLKSAYSIHISNILSSFLVL